MKKRSSFAAAIFLIAIGAWFLAIELSPTLKSFAYGLATWPLQIIGIGALLALLALITWSPGLFVPACIVGGIGGLLYWQNATGNWGSWAYAWALIPGFVGVGILLQGLLTGNRKTITGGGWTILNSLVLFAIFGTFLGGLGIVSQYWPVLLIALGVLLFSQGVLRRR
jgi:hypothetical protein